MSNAHIGGGAGGGGGGDVSAASSLADNAVIRGNGGAKVVQDSLMFISDTGVVTGITQLNVDNLRLDGNTISSTDTNGNITITPDGSGVIAGTELTLTTDLAVAHGGSGRSSHTAYAVLCGGTTTTAAQQSVSGLGASGQALVSNGAGALPTFQTVAGSGDVTAAATLTDNTIIRGDVASKAVQDSSITISDTDVISGVTQLNVDNLRFDGNTIISTDTNGNITITPDGSGVIAGTELTLTTDLAVTHGGSARSSAIAYSVVCGGTTSTGAHQSVADVGSVGEVLVSGGAGVLPAWSAAGSGDVSAASVMANNAIVRGEGGSKGVQDSGVLIDDSDNVSGIGTLGMGGNLTNYEAVNDGNPEIRLGSADAEELHIQSVYDGGAQTLDYVLLQTDAASATANKGLFRFNVDGSDICDIDDGGIDLDTGGALSINGTDVIDATSLGSGVLASSLTSVGTIATGVWNGTAILDEFGGTGQSTYTKGDILYASATNVLSKLAIGTDGQVLNVATDVPAWGTVGAGDVLKVNTPVDNQIGVWTGDGTLEGDASFLWDGTGLKIEEVAAPSSSTATFGQLWIKNTTPNEIWFTDDAGTDVQLGVGGGGSMPAKEYFWGAENLQALETNFAPIEKLTGTNVKVNVRAFDDSTEEYINGKLQAPGDIDTSGTVTFRAYVSAKTAAASKNIALTFGHLALNDSEDWDPSTPYTDEDSGDKAIDATQDDVTEVTWTASVSSLAWAANDMVLFRVSRPNAPTNDLVGDMYMFSFTVEIPRA